MTTAVDAKTSARQRVRAFLQARATYAASLGHSGYVPDEITRQASDSHITTTFPVMPGEALAVSYEGQQPIHLVPLLASDLAILAADD